LVVVVIFAKIYVDYFYVIVYGGEGRIMFLEKAYFGDVPVIIDGLFFCLVLSWCCWLMWW
jgi:hypothetical protein